MSRIDFPSQGDTHIDENGVSWKKINNSWVKQFDWADEAPATGGVQYCKLNQVWTPIAFPVAEDDPNDGTIYARQSNGWVAVTTNVGPAAPGVDGLLYGIRDGVWDLIPGDDLTVNYYSKTISDGRFATIAHTHTLSEITDSGAMAAEADAGAVDDDVEYVRKNHAWVEKAAIIIPKHSNSVTIIDPQDTDDAILFWTPIEVTLDQIRVVALPSGASVNFNIFHASVADGTAGDTTQILNADFSAISSEGQSVTPDNPIIPAGNYIWIGVMGQPSVGTTMFHMTITY